MLAAVLHGSRDVRVEAVSAPVPSPGQVLLRVHRAGICGSDTHYFMHGRCGTFVPTRPFILGHEFVATVEAVGPDVVQPEVGERVVVNPASSCGHCEACQSGRRNLCSRVVMLGSASTTPPTDGSFCEQIVVAAYQCYSLPETIADGVAAMTEPLSVALHAIRRANGVAGERVLVCGAGPIGLLTALTAKSFGAGLVAISEPAEARRDKAALMGIDLSFDPGTKYFASQARSHSDGGFDVVFEASGAVQAVQSTLEVARSGGRIIQIGTVGASSVELPINSLMVRELSLLGTFRYANEFPSAIRLVASGRLDISRLVTSTFSLRDISQALEVASQSNETLKVHIIVES